jgi:dUTP pyrophosphatase
MDTVRVFYFRDARQLYGEGPAYSTEGSAGLDLRACFSEELRTVPPGARTAVPAGVALEITLPGTAGFVYSRSGLGAVQGLTVAQGVGVVDPDYRGEIVVYLLNTSPEVLTIRRGERVAQLVFQPFARLRPVPAESLADSGRGTGGFGHTGRN